MQRKTFPLLDGSLTALELSDYREGGYYLCLEHPASSDMLVAFFRSRSDAELAFAALSRADTIA
jgi:hypothetical protein